MCMFALFIIHLPWWLKLSERLELQIIHNSLMHASNLTKRIPSLSDRKIISLWIQECPEGNGILLCIWVQ